MSETTTTQNKNYLFNVAGDQLPFKNSVKKISKEGLERLKSLYPYTDFTELPLAFSSKDKANYIFLSDNNLKVHYKGIGKGDKDAASVRAEKPIPKSCLLYYYEVKVISKGRDGYIGVGLSAQSVNLQRLPGWDKQAYGYHGDDGQCFGGCGQGTPYGPRFSTNDVIGCGFNLVENKCFYTKNGFSLGIAFHDLVNLPLFPVVGLQTPCEEVEVNFGVDPFLYDIRQDIEAVKQKLTMKIINFPVKYNEWQYTINKIIQSWLIHNGYCSTAEVFSSSSKQDFKVNTNAIKQRFKIQQLVLAGKIGEAINLTNKLYPNVFKDNPNLLFALKCRQFIEMVNGFDLIFKLKQKTSNGNNFTDLIKNENEITSEFSQNNENIINSNLNTFSESMEIDETDEYENNTSNSTNLKENCDCCNGEKISKCINKMERQKKKKKSNNFNNSIAKLSQLLEFGNELHSLSMNLTKKYGLNKKNEKMLRDAFSLIAYADPSNSLIGWQLHPCEREQVCVQLNNAIIKTEQEGCCIRPPLESIIKQTKSLLRLNGNFGVWIIEKL